LQKDQPAFRGDQMCSYCSHMEIQTQTTSV